MRTLLNTGYMQDISAMLMCNKNCAVRRVTKGGNNILDKSADGW
jgi:hypothetical protein